MSASGAWCHWLCLLAFEFDIIRLQAAWRLFRNDKNAKGRSSGSACEVERAGNRPIRADNLSDSRVTILCNFGNICLFQHHLPQHQLCSPFAMIGKDRVFAIMSQSSLMSLTHRAIASLCAYEYPALTHSLTHTHTHSFTHT